MKLLTALRSEMLTTKRTASFYLPLAVAAAIPTIFLLNVLTGGSDLDSIRSYAFMDAFSIINKFIYNWNKTV